MFIDVARMWFRRRGGSAREWRKVFAQRFSRKLAELPGEWAPGGVERRIVAEVAVQLRMSPRFSDDGRPEGTCDRPLSIHLDEQEPARVEVEEEPAQEINSTDDSVRAFRG